MPDSLVIAVNSDNVSQILSDCNLPYRVTAKTVADILKKGSPSPEIAILYHEGDLRKILKRLDELFPLTPIIIISDKRPPLPSYFQKRSLTGVISSNQCSALGYFIRDLLKQKRTLLEIAQLKNENSELQFLVDIYEEINHQMTDTEDRKELITKIMQKIKNVSRIHEWAFFLKNPEDDILHLFAISKKMAPIEIKLSFGEAIAGRAIKQGSPVLIPDIRRNKYIQKEAPLHRALKSKSILALPLKTRDSVIGAMELIYRKNTSFDEKDIQLFDRVAEHVAMAVEKAMLHQKMAELAITDDLTKIFNTRYLHRTLDIEVERCKRYNTSVSLIFMDIDRFKEINDKYGHLVGSKVLVEVAQLILNKIRALDIVARYGGDEFVIVLPQTSSKYATQIAERLRKNIAETVFLKKEGYNIKLTASFGVASYPETANSKDELLRLADEAMYKVKYQTRDGVYAII